LESQKSNEQEETEEKEEKEIPQNNNNKLKYQKKQTNPQQQKWKPKEKKRKKQNYEHQKMFFKRVKWDPQYDINDFVVVYEDRLMGGMMEKPMSEWTKDEVDSIPFHRIWQFKNKGQIVWDRKSRLDLLFN